MSMHVTQNGSIASQLLEFYLKSPHVDPFVFEVRNIFIRNNLKNFIPELPTCTEGHIFML